MSGSLDHGIVDIILLHTGSGDCDPRPVYNVAVCLRGSSLLISGLHLSSVCLEAPTPQSTAGPRWLNLHRGPAVRTRRSGGEGTRRIGLSNGKAETKNERAFEPHLNLILRGVKLHPDRAMRLVLVPPARFLGSVPLGKIPPPVMTQTLLFGSVGIWREEKNLPQFSRSALPV